MDIIVTMPDVKKEGYEKLIKWYEEHKDEQHYFRVSQLPKNCVAGEWWSATDTSSESTRL